MIKENPYRKALKNYSTTVPVNRTITEIQEILLQFGARGIGFEYNDEGMIEGVTFKINIKDNDQLISVPFRVENTIQVLKNQRKFKDEAHAYRVAARNVKDLLDAQMAFLATEMVKFEELFLPFFVTKSGKTVFEVIEDKDFNVPLLTD